MRRRRDAGFTLLEILVALVVLGFVLAAVGQGVQFGMRAADTQLRRTVASEDIDAVDRLLRRMIEQADPGHGTDAPEFDGGPASLALVTSLTQQGAPVDALLRADNGRLVLRYSPHRHVVPLGPPPPPAVEVLLEGVRRVEFAYWGAAAGQPAQWLGVAGKKEIPGLVRIRLVMEAGRPPWPDIIAATVLHRAAS